MKLHTGLVLLSMVVMAGCADSEASTEEPGAASGGSRLAVYRGDLTSRILLTGELVAEDAEQLVAPNVNVWPLSIRWLAEDGAEVAEGDRAVEFDNSQLVANLQEMRAQVIEAGNRLESLRAQAAAEEARLGFELEQRRAEVAKAQLEADVPKEAYAARTYQRFQLDLQRAQLELEEAETKMRATRQAKQAEIDIQRIALEQAQTEAVRSEERIEVLTLRASRSGILILENNRQEERPFQVGDTAFPSRTVARLPDLATLIVAARLFDVDDGRITAGMAVEATLDAFPDRQFTGVIREIDQIADQASSRSLRRFFRTRIDLDEVDVEHMRPGMSVKLLIEEAHAGALLVPRASVDWTEDGPRALLEDGSWVAVVLGDCDTQACILEAGLDEATSLRRVTAEQGRG